MPCHGDGDADGVHLFRFLPCTEYMYIDGNFTVHTCNVDTQWGIRFIKQGAEKAWKRARSFKPASKVLAMSSGGPRHGALPGHKDMPKPGRWEYKQGHGRDERAKRVHTYLPTVLPRYVRVQST